MVFFTINRIRLLGKIVGVSCILVGLIILFFVPATGWPFQHPYAFASFVALLGIGLVAIIFTRVRNPALLVKEAAMAGYTASEEEERRLEDGFRLMGKLYLVVPLAYTIVWLLLICFVVDPTGILPLEGIGSLYFALTWSVPVFYILLFAIPYSTDRMCPEARVLVRKSGEGRRLMKIKRKLGEANPEDLGIMKEDESKKEKKESPS